MNSYQTAARQKIFNKSGIIRQLSLNDNIEADFFIFSGSINTDYYYLFYGQNNDEIRLIKLLHDKVSIYEDIEAGEVPYYKQMSHYYWEIHIPKNSITHKIDVNLIK